MINTFVVDEVKQNFKQMIPWRLRYMIKIAEAKGICIPSLFKQQSDEIKYNNALSMVLESLNVENFEDKTILEMGSGQLVTRAFIEYLLGAKTEYLLEISDLANCNKEFDRSKLRYTFDYKLIKALPDFPLNQTWFEALKMINARYYFDGINGYKRVPDESIDVVFSFAVLEHIRKKEFIQTMTESYRFMKKGGIAIHTVDFTDHLGGKKNHLRFSDEVWEDDIHYRMDNYTNRIQFSEMISLLKKIGFEIISAETTKFKDIPINRKYIYREISIEDLLIENAKLVLIKS